MAKMGTMAQDKVSGFKGLVTGRVEYLHGQTDLLLSPQVKPDGQFVEPQWFAASRVVSLEPQGE